MSDWSSLHGMSLRSGGDADSVQGGGSLKGGGSADVESLQGMSTRGTDMDSMQEEGRDPGSNQILSAVADAIEQLRAAGHEQEDKEKIAGLLSQLADSSVDGRAAIGYHAQAIPLLVSLLRSGTIPGRTHAAATLGILCDEEELRVKVLLGGCIPPMLALLKVGPKESQLVAAEALFAVSKGGPSRDQVGTKIFATEGVVPALLEQLQPEVAIYPDVVGLLTGTLRNLCYSVEGFWQTAEEAGGVEIFASLLSSGKPITQENSAALLTSYLTSPLLMQSQNSLHSGVGNGALVVDPSTLASHHATMVANAGAVKPLLALLEPGKDVPLRTEVAGALRALSAGTEDVRLEIAEAGGVPTLIRATVAPSSEMMQTGYAQMLQENSMGALANIAGGKAPVVNSLAEGMEQCTDEQELADMTGALAYALMVLDGKAEALGTVNAVAIEVALVQRLSQLISELLQERAIEALASLYGNPFVAKSLRYSEAKRMLVGLITLSTPEGQKELIQSHVDLCSGETDLWTALGGREGVLQLVGLLGLSTEDQQEYASTLLYILTNEKDESKWAITAAGGIPPLVQLLGTGTAKAKEDAAAVLGNLCGHSEDIRACVETAEATPALLSLLGSGSPRGQAISARALTRLVSGSNASASTIGQLTGILVADLPESKVHVLRVLGHLLAEAPDVPEEGSAANEALQTLVNLLENEREESQESAAAVLANLFAAREDLRESRAAIDAIPPLVRLVDYGSEQIAMQAARALAAIFCSIDTNYEAAQVAKDGIFPLVKLAKSKATSVAEVATTALANLLANEELAQFAPAEEVMLPLSRLLREGTAQGKEHAAGALAHLLHSRAVDEELADCIRQCSTVLALVQLLAVSSGEEATMAALEALAALARAKPGHGFSRPPLQVLSEVPYSISPLVACLSSGTPIMQEKTIEVLSRLCKDQPVVLGDLLAGTAGCIVALTERITGASSLEVKVGGTALLICAAKEHRQSTMECMTESGTFVKLVRCLVAMLASHTPDDNDAHGGGEASAALLVNSVALWLLAVVASHDSKSKQLIAEAGAIDILTEKLAVFSPNARAMDASADDSGGSWVSALLLAILFCDRDVTRGPAAMRAVHPLANLLRSEEPSDRYFAAQALASQVSTGSRGTLLAVANSGAASGLLAMLGNMESDISHLTALAEDFGLAVHPEQVALERLFRCDDIQKGPVARKAIPALVDLLKPMPERPGAPPLALGLLTQIAKGSENNKIAMAESSAVEALTKYLSIGPQESIEEAAAELLRILFSSEELRTHSSAGGAVEQLVAVLRLGTRGARYSAARALEGLFVVDAIRTSETASQAILPLVEMVASGLEKEQRAAVTALIKLTFSNAPKIATVAEAEGNVMEALCRTLSSDFSLALKEECVELLRILCGLPRIRSSPAATAAIAPIVTMLSQDSIGLQYRAAAALDTILEDEHQAEIVAANGAVVPLTNLLEGERPGLHATACSALLKLAKDHRMCKTDMASAGVIERMLAILPKASSVLAALFVELLRVLSNNPSIARGASMAKAAAPLLNVLQRPDLNPGAQNSALQALANLVSQPELLASLNLEPTEALPPLTPLLSSPYPVVQQLTANVTSHLLSQESFQKDSVVEQLCAPLVRLLSSEAESLQAESLEALGFASLYWSSTIADANGVVELSRLVATAGQAIWQLAATVLTNILQTEDKYYAQVSMPVLVRLLMSNTESIQLGALSPLMAMLEADPTLSQQMAETGVVEALLGLLGTHQVDKESARLLETIFISPKVCKMPQAVRAIAPLSTYLLHPESKDQEAKLLVTLALGALFQDESLTRVADAATSCRALVSILVEPASEELHMVAICGLQCLVATSMPNKRAFAEAGGIAVLQEMLPRSSPEIISQLAGLILALFKDNTAQEQGTPDLIQSLAQILLKAGKASEGVVKAIECLWHKFPALRATQQSTAAIPMLVVAMKAGNEQTKEAALNAMWCLRQGWSKNKSTGKQQAMACSEAIPVLQLMQRSGPVRLTERAEALLSVLPGTLSVTIKRGSNLKMAMGQTNAFCKVTLGDGAPRTTTVVQQSTAPEWKQGFSWPLDVPPTGQKLHIHCKSKVALGTGSLGKVTIQIDRVVALGFIADKYPLQPENNRDGTQRTLEIEFVWSHR